MLIAFLVCYSHGRKSLFEEAEKYFDRDTGVLEAPMIIRVADQVSPEIGTPPHTLHLTIPHKFYLCG